MSYSYPIRKRVVNERAPSLQPLAGLNILKPLDNAGWPINFHLFRMVVSTKSEVNPVSNYANVSAIEVLDEFE